MGNGSIVNFYCTINNTIVLCTYTLQLYTMNINNKTEVIRYIRKLIGHNPTIFPLSKTEQDNVPVYLLEIYELFHLKLFNRKLILAVINNEEGGFTPSEYAAHVEQLHDALRDSIALVLTHIKAYERNRLTGKGVPFIVPGRQLFLPQFLVDLKDYFPRKKSVSRKTLSYPAQLVVLYHLIKEDIEPYSLRELADKVGYSAMTLSNVADELSGFELCEAVTTGRKRNLQFQLQGKQLWENVLPHLRNPIQSCRWIRYIPRRNSVFKAGITALSEYTHISEDFLPTYAMRNKEYRRLLETGDLIGCHGPDEAQAQIESWFYIPELLADNNIVDKLSLYLALQDSPDERVRKSLREMMGEIGW